MSKWSLEEEKYLLNNWGQLEVGLIMKVLNRTKDSVVRKAHRLGLDIHKSPGQSLKRRWTADEERILIEFYQTIPMSDILLLLPDRTREGVIKRAKSLGLNFENRYWTQEETAYLEEKWGVVQIDNIAKKLGRTKNAVLLKAHKLGLREQVIANGEYLTPKDIAEVLGVGTKTIYNWMNKDYMKYRRLKINSVKKYQITFESFKTFLEMYQDKWDTRLADIKFIKACYYTCSDSGRAKAPTWLLHKVEKDKHKKALVPRKQWTVKEELTLKTMIDKGKTCREIAQMLNRSFFSVQGKVSSKMRGQVLDNSAIGFKINEINIETLRAV